MRIYNQDIRMECGIEKCVMQIIKSRKQHMTEGIEQPNQEKIRTLGEKETFKCLRLLEADIIKQVEKEKKNKSISGEKENFSRQNYIAGILSKGWILELSTSENSQNHSWSGPENWKNGPENKKTNDHVYGITSQRWRRQIMQVKKRKRRKTYQLRKQRWRIDTTTRRLHRKARWKTDHSYQKQYWQHEKQQNGNNQKTKMGKKQLNGRFKRPTSDISQEKTWTWLKRGNFKRETESL